MLATSIVSAGTVSCTSNMRLRGGGSPVRESLKDREREEREREPVCVCERERDLIRSQCPAGSGPGDVSTPITCLQTLIIMFVL